MALLDGILVADFSRVLAGPFATMLLGDLGADVVKVERPGTGDDTRAWGPPWRDELSTYYLGLNRNKRSVVLDLAEEGDRGLAGRLASRSSTWCAGCWRPTASRRRCWSASAPARAATSRSR